MAKFVALKESFDPVTTCGLCEGPLDEAGDGITREQVELLLVMASYGFCVRYAGKAPTKKGSDLIRSMYSFLGKEMPDHIVSILEREPNGREDEAIP